MPFLKEKKSSEGVIFGFAATTATTAAHETGPSRRQLHPSHPRYSHTIQTISIGAWLGCRGSSLDVSTPKVPRHAWHDGVESAIGQWKQFGPERTLFERPRPVIARKFLTIPLTGWLYSSSTVAPTASSATFIASASFSFKSSFTT